MTGSVFVPSREFINAVFEIVSNRDVPQELQKTPPTPPTK